MKEDVMVIPLRVPREIGRSWKMEAVKQDKSVQRWILDRLEGCEQGTCTNGDAQRGVAKARTKNVKDTSDVSSESKCPAPSPSIKPSLTPEEVEAKQRSCKHAFVPGSRQCVKCGWVPPIVS